MGTKKDPRGLLKGLPRKVLVGGVSFSIEVVTDAQEPIMQTNNGYCMQDDGRILLNAAHVTNGAPENVLNTVVHEVSHAINSLFGVDDGITEEEFVTRHTNGLVAFWLDNPGFDLWRRRVINEARAARTVDTH